MIDEAIEKRVDRLDERVEEAIKLMNAIYTDVKIIKTTCENRGSVCMERFVNIEKKVIRLETDIDGEADRSGFRTRVAKLEDKSQSKEKYLFLTIGALGTGVITLAFFFLEKIFTS
jgi:hypothetical protein